MPVGGNEDVARFDIPVHNQLAVSMLDSPRHASKQRQPLIDIGLQLVALNSYRLAVHQFHAGNSRVFQARQQVPFLVEAGE